MKSYLVYFLLVVALVLGFATRFYKLGEAPAGFYLDEAGQGYSAFSILKTGKDEFGKPFPIVFRSFTDFKTPVYIYLIVPLIPLFGLTKFAVRFPSFFFSMLTFPIVYLLLKEISPKKIAKPIAVLTSLLLAISPWHILFGRTNFETNVALAFLLAGILFFYKGLKKPPLLVASALSLAIAMPAYHSQRVVAPLMILALVWHHRKTLFIKTHRKFLFTGAVIGFIISLPTLAVATTPGFLARASGLNIFNYDRQLPAGFLENCQGILNFVVNSKFFLSTREFLALYLSYFSPRYMFVLGDSGLRSAYPELATFFIWQAPFYLYGLWILLKSKDLKELRLFTILLLLIAPIPAAVTRDPYSTIRSEPLVIPQLIIISLGLIESFKILKNKALKVSVLALFTLVLLYSLAKLYSSIIVLNEYYRATYWGYGWEQVVETLNNLDEKLPVVVDNARTEAYIQIAFFKAYNPETFQKENLDINLDEYYTDMNRIRMRKIGNITTRSIDWEKDIYLDQYLVGDELSISEEQIKEHSLKTIRTVSFPDWSIAYRIVATNPKAKCAQPGASLELCY